MAIHIITSSERWSVNSKAASKNRFTASVRIYGYISLRLCGFAFRCFHLARCKMTADLVGIFHANSAELLSFTLYPSTDLFDITGSIQINIDYRLVILVDLFLYFMCYRCNR